MIDAEKFCKIALSGLLAAVFTAGCSTGSQELAKPADQAAEVPQALVDHVLETGLSGETMRFNLAEIGVGGTISPLRTFKTSHGLYCRDYMMTVERTDGSSRNWTETACRIADAQWRNLPGDEV